MAINKDEQLKRLEAALRKQFRSDHDVELGASVRASVLEYVGRFPAGVEEEALALRLEKTIKREFDAMEAPLLSPEVKERVFRAVRPLEAEEPLTFADALWRLAAANTPLALCLAFYVWSTGVIPDYPLDAYPPPEAEAAGLGDSQ